MYQHANMEWAQNLHLVPLLFLQNVWGPGHPTQRQPQKFWYSIIPPNTPPTRHPTFPVAPPQGSAGGLPTPDSPWGSHHHRPAFHPLRSAEKACCCILVSWMREGSGPLCLRTSNPQSVHFVNSLEWRMVSTMLTPLNRTTHVTQGSVFGPLHFTLCLLQILFENTQMTPKNIYHW